MAGFLYGFPQPTPLSASERTPVNLAIAPELPPGPVFDRLRDALGEWKRLREALNAAIRARQAAKLSLDAAPGVDRAAAAERFRAGDRTDRGTPHQDEARAALESAQRQEQAAFDALAAADRDVRRVLEEDRDPLAAAASELAEQADREALAAIDVLEAAVLHRFERHRLAVFAAGQKPRPPIRGVDGTGDLGRALAALRKELHPPSRRARVVAVSPGVRAQARRDLWEDPDD